jgi:hypothetical protein
MGRKLADIVGKRFGKLVVVKYYDTKGKNSRWLCKCDCGNEKVVSCHHLLGKVKPTQSCGCLTKEIATKHGMWRTPFYNSWASMKQRCSNKNSEDYKDYGERGIGYDPRWDLFENFYTDMYLKYLYATKQLKVKYPSIERIDVNKNYCFDNCIFIEMKDQGKNRRCIKEFKATSPRGLSTVAKNQSEFAREFGLSDKNINACLMGHKKTHFGWKFEYI